MSSNVQSGLSSGKEKEIYFIILRPSEEKVDLDLEFSSSEFAPSRIYKKVIQKGKDSFIEENVFKLIIKESEKRILSKTKTELLNDINEFRQNLSSDYYINSKLSKFTNEVSQNNYNGGTI